MLFGGSGDDVINGISGYDIAAGGLGNDSYTDVSTILFNKGDGVDKISKAFVGGTVISVGQTQLSELSLVRANNIITLRVGSIDSLQLAPSSATSLLQLVSTDVNGLTQVKIYNLATLSSALTSMGAGLIEGTSFDSHHVATYFDKAYGGDIALAYARTGYLDTTTESLNMGYQAASNNPMSLQSIRSNLSEFTSTSTHWTAVDLSAVNDLRYGSDPAASLAATAILSTDDTFSSDSANEVSSDVPMNRLLLATAEQSPRWPSLLS